MMSVSFRDEFQLSSLSLNHANMECFHQAQWDFPSWVYPVWRLLWCVWHCVWLVVSGVRTQNSAPDDQPGAKWLIYASNWTFLLTTIFCLVDLIVVVSAAWRRFRKNGNNPELPQVPASSDKDEILFQGEFTLVKGIKTPTIPNHVKLQWFLFETTNCVNLLSTIAFWASQYNDDDYLYADIIVFNIINSIFVIANALITAIPVNILHFVYPFIFVVVYVLFNLIYFLADGTAINETHVIFQPLQWDEAYPTTFTLIVGLFILLPLSHLVFYSLFTLRTYLYDRFINDGLGGRVNGGSDTTVTNELYRRRNSAVVSAETDLEHTTNYDQGHWKKGGHENAAFTIETDTPSGYS